MSAALRRRLRRRIGVLVGVLGAGSLAAALAVAWWRDLDLVGFLLVLAVTSLATDLVIAYLVNEQPPVTGVETMVGETAEVVRPFVNGPGGCEGRVRYRNELWRAGAPHGQALQPGDRVVIRAVEGLRLRVERGGGGTGGSGHGGGGRQRRGPAAGPPDTG